MKKFLVVLLISLFCFIPVDAKEVKYKIVSGDIETVGSEVCFDTECFYVIGNDDNNVKLLAKYNLYVGGQFKGRKLLEYGDDATGLQDSRMLGGYDLRYDSEGIIMDFTNVYWTDTITEFPAYIYGENTNIYPYIEFYSFYLKSMNVAVDKARIISYEELVELGCSDATTNCSNAPSWVYSTSYWVGSATANKKVWAITNNNKFITRSPVRASYYGVRPVIEVPVKFFDDDGNVYFGSISKIDSKDGVISNDDNSIDIIFNDLGQEVKYQTIIYNDTHKDLFVHDIETKNISEKFLDIRLDSRSENMIVESGGSSLITFYVRTLKEEGAGRNLDDNITIKFRLSDKNLNPDTFSNIFEMIILIIVLAGTIYFIRNNKNKKVKALILVGVVSLLSFNYVYADDFMVVSIPGKVKYLSQNNIISCGTVLNDRKADYTNSKEVWAYYDKIKNVEVKSIMNKPKDYFKEFDLTENKTGRVMGYLIKNGDKNTPYDLVIMSNGVVIANSDSSFMFSFPNVEEVEGLSNMDFRNTTTMQGMFIGNNKLVSIDADALEMDNTKNTSFMFYNCSKITHTKSDFNLENVTNSTMMFTDNLYEDIKLGSKNDSGLNYLSSTDNGKYYIDSTKNNNFPIHFYRGNVNNNNVVFGNYCWKIVRTTDTGGIKLLYNGVPATDGSCNNKGTNSIISSSKVSTNLYSLAVAGYMYGDNEYKNSNYTHTKVSWNNEILSMDNTNNYIYGTSVTYDGSSYTLVNPKNYLWKDNYNNVLGYYTCLSETETTCKSMYYVFYTSNKVMHLARIYDGDVEKSIHITLYKNIEVNEDGTFNLINPEEIDKAYYSKNHEKYLGYYAPSSKCISNCGSIYIVAATSGTDYTADTTINHKYSNEFTYENGKYTLVNPFVAKNGMRLDYNEVSKYKYSCGNSTGTCSELNYITSINDKYYYYYIKLKNGEDIETAISKMNSNSNDSLIKVEIDNWFKNNMLSYEEKLEDTVWYNDRTFSSGRLSGGTMTNGTSMFSSYFKLYNKKDYSYNYKNKKDMFTVSNKNGNCSLTYPVGTITLDELSYAGAGINGKIINNYLDIDTNWWTMTPAKYSNVTIYYASVDTSGGTSIARCDKQYGIRPMVSLKHGVLYSNGDGTVNNPYVIE